MAAARPETIPETIVGQDTTRLPLFRVLLHNDDRNTMDHVVHALLAVFAFDGQEAERIMWEAHNNGVAVCAVEPLEQAEFHRDRLRSFSLTATIEPA